MRTRLGTEMSLSSLMLHSDRAKRSEPDLFLCERERERSEERDRGLER